MSYQKQGVSCKCLDKEFVISHRGTIKGVVANMDLQPVSHNPQDLLQLSFNCPKHPAETVPGWESQRAGIPHPTLNCFQLACRR